MMIRALALLAALAATSAQAASPPLLPRTPDGRPDLNGTWSNSSVTQLNRPAGTPLIVDEATAKKIAQGNGMVRRAEADAKPSNPNEGAPSDRNTDAGYNAFWMDPGMSLARIDGQYRTSWVVQPADGQVPFTDLAKANQRRSAARQRNAPRGPEDMAPNDRCIIGSRGSGGPGMLNNLYNNTYMIVQTKDAIAIWIEMVHDVRTIPIFPSKAVAQSKHGPAALNLWLGDSVAWWEGDTLVVETTHVNPEQGGYGPIFLSADGKVTERFRRASTGQINYAFEVEDSVYYTAPWKAEMSLNAMNGLIYEFACHEGNYAMEGMLAGARADEAKAVAAKAAP